MSADTIKDHDHRLEEMKDWLNGKDPYEKRINFGDYQNFVNGIKVYPEQHKIVYPMFGVMGEAGECSEKVKKWLRGDKELDKNELAKELGDVLWYLAALADDLGYDLEYIANQNIEKLTDRKNRNVLKGEGDGR